MNLLRRIGLCVVAAAIFCTLVLPVLALYNYNGAWSINKKAWAYVKGWWNIIDHYYKTYHEGEVKDAESGAFTFFRGLYNGFQIYGNITYLNPYSGFWSYYYERVDLIYTVTDSKTGINGSIAVYLRPGIEK